MVTRTNDINVGCFFLFWFFCLFEKDRASLWSRAVLAAIPAVLRELVKAGCLVARGLRLDAPCTGQCWFYRSLCGVAAF